MVTTAPVKTSKMFGAGSFYGINNVTDPTPTTFDAVQDQSITFKRDVKTLFGDNQFGEDVSAGTATVTGKVTMGSLNGRIVGDLIVGAATPLVQDSVAKFEKVVVNKTAYTAKVNNASGFLEDLGVRDPSTNLPLVRVATITKSIHYTVSGSGLYTFHPLLAGETLAVSYRYQTASNAVLGTKLLLANQPMGKIGDFTAVHSFEWAKEQNVFTLNACIASDFEIGSKQGDYSKPSFAYTASVDNYGNLGTFSFAQRR